MKTETEVRRALREWVIRTNGKIAADALTDRTPIIEQRIVTSLQITDLLLFLEELTGRAIDVEKLKPGIFRDIDAIYENFFGKADGV
jgi:acyl carrier protein